MAIYKLLFFAFISQFIILTNSTFAGAIGGVDFHQKAPLVFNNPSIGSDKRTFISHPAAMQFVKTTGLHKSLSLLLLDSVKHDNFIENAIQAHGFPNVKASVVTNIKLTTTRYRQEWEILLAQIYGNQFSDTELLSIIENGENSPYYTRFIERQSEMGTSNQLVSSDIFKKAYAELIQSLAVNFAT